MKMIPILYMALFAVLAVANSPAQDNDTDVRVHVERIGDKDAGWLGVTLSSKITRTERDGDEIEERTDGAVVDFVVDESPADSAGLEEGDVITRVNSEDIGDASDLVDAIREKKPGDMVTLTVMRDGDEKQIGVVLGKREDAFGIAATVFKNMPKNLGRMAGKLGGMAKNMKFFAGKPVLGIKVQTLEKQLGEYFNAPNGKGVLVTEVMDIADSPAQQAGMQAGDVVVKINAESVEDRHDITSALEGLKKGDKLTIDVIRKGQRKTLTATLNEDVAEDGGMKMMEWHGKAPMGGRFDSDEDEHHIRMMIPQMDMDDEDFDIDIDSDEMNDAVRKIRVKVKKIIDDMDTNGEHLERIREEIEKQRHDIRREVEKAIEQEVNVRHI